MQTLQGMQDDSVGSAAATLLHQILLHLRLDLAKQSGQSMPHYFTWLSFTLELHEYTVGCYVLKYL